MDKRSVGKLQVSPVGMGCMGFSHGYGALPTAEYAIDAIRAAYDFGCTFFDTAEVYGPNLQENGHNERIVGKAVSGFRKDVQICTKLMPKPGDIGQYNSVYAMLRHHAELSLKALGTDYIDLYYLHRPASDIEIEEISYGMGLLIRDGIIREWGLSNVLTDYLDRAHKVTPVAAVQNIYSMMERGFERNVIPYCKENNIAFVPFSPIASGFLSGKIAAGTEYIGDDVRKWVSQTQPENMIANRPVLDLLEKYAVEKNATKAQISLAWMLSKYPHVVPIPGSKNKERILENLGAWNVTLTEQEFKALDEELEKIPLYGRLRSADESMSLKK